MARLGPKQIELLLAVGVRSAVVVGDRMTARLCELGMMQSEPNGSFARITPAGLRALADAMEDGRIPPWELPVGRKPAP
jgi:hypothetical protein